MKKFFMVFVATLICGACLFTSCKKDKDNTDLNLKEKIIGKWMPTDFNGEAMPTNGKAVYTFVSTTKAYVSASYHSASNEYDLWDVQEERDVAINGNKVILTTHPDEHTTGEEVFTVTAINGNEFTANYKVSSIVDGTVVFSRESTMRFLKVTSDYKQAILGTWEGHCTSEGSVFDDGEEHRWEYKADGTYVYYVKDGENWVPYATSTLSEYFVDGKLLCTRWVDNGVENREWWEISINGNRMNWTALRKNDDGSTFTATFEMEKVN